MVQVQVQNYLSSTASGIAGVPSEHSVGSNDGNTDRLLDNVFVMGDGNVVDTLPMGTEGRIYQQHGDDGSTVFNVQEENTEDEEQGNMVPRDGAVPFVLDLERLSIYHFVRDSCFYFYFVGMIPTYMVFYPYAFYRFWGFLWVLAANFAIVTIAMPITFWLFCPCSLNLRRRQKIQDSSILSIKIYLLQSGILILQLPARNKNERFPSGGELLIPYSDVERIDVGSSSAVPLLGYSVTKVDICTSTEDLSKYVVSGYPSFSNSDLVTILGLKDPFNLKRSIKEKQNQQRLRAT